MQPMLLRSMQQAVYSPENVGHFGLAYEHYTHFTSPIRRYPDLIVHRLAKAYLSGAPDREVEALADRPLNEMDIDALESLWQRAKRMT